ncbi:unnamed protein product, partial [Allacma fusca]
DPELQRTALDVIDSLLSKDSNGNYSRISYIKQPSQAGLLTTMPDVMDQRSHMRHVVENNTVFVRSSPDDFGMSVSPGAQALSLNLTHVTQQKMIALVASIQGKIQSKYAELITNTSFNTVGSAVNKFHGLQQIPETIQDLASREEFLHQLTTEL